MLAGFAVHVYGNDYDTWHGTLCLEGGRKINFKSTAELLRIMDERIKKAAEKEMARKSRKSRNPIIEGKYSFSVKKDRLVEEIMYLLDNGTIRVWQDAGDDAAKCQIEECWFRFTHMEEDTYLEDFATDELAEMIAGVINVPQADDGLSEDDAEYCRAMISLCFLKDSFKLKPKD